MHRIRLDVGNEDQGDQGRHDGQARADPKHTLTSGQRSNLAIPVVHGKAHGVAAVGAGATEAVDDAGEGVGANKGADWHGSVY